MLGELDQDELLAVLDSFEFDELDSFEFDDSDLTEYDHEECGE